MAEQRQNRGKQKIEIKLIEKPEDRIAAFSKRKSGICKKANEIATLCGAEVGFVTFTPKGKPYSFAQPSMESIENRLIVMENAPLMSNPSTISEDHPHARTHQQEKLEGLCKHYTKLDRNLDEEKEKRKVIDQKLVEKSVAKDNSGKGWWDTPVDDLGYEELLEMNDSLEELQKKLCNHINGERRAANKNHNVSSGKKA